MGVFRSFLTMSKGAKEATNIGAIAMAGAAFDGVTTYAAERMEDPEGSKAKALMKAGGTAAAWMFAEPLMWGITLGQGAVGLTKMAYEEADKNWHQQRDINMHVRKDRTGANAGTLGGNFQDSQNAYTMRQRQMDLLRQHKMATESILGSEARQLHR